MTEVTENHKRFLRMLDGSVPAVFVVALWLHYKGYAIEIPALRRAPTAADHAEYSDDGDLFVFVYWHYDVRRRYEVKHLDVTFSGRHDWPFGDRIFVDKASKVDRAGRDVVGYITVSHDFGALAVIPANAREHWRKIEVFNRKSGNIDLTYSCPLMYADFEALDFDKLNGR